MAQGKGRDVREHEQDINGSKEKRNRRLKTGKEETTEEDRGEVKTFKKGVDTTINKRCQKWNEAGKYVGR